MATVIMYDKQINILDKMTGFSLNSTTEQANTCAIIMPTYCIKLKFVVYYLTVLSNMVFTDILSGGKALNKENLANDLLVAFESVNKKGILEKNKFHLKGENLMLALLTELGGKATPGELIHYTDFTAARLTAISKQLEAKGFVTRNKNKEDRRSTVIEITSDGMAQFVELKKEILKNVTVLVEKLGEKDAEDFLRLMNRFAEISAELA